MLHVSFGNKDELKCGFGATGVIQNINIKLDDKLWVKEGQIL